MTLNQFLKEESPRGVLLILGTLVSAGLVATVLVNAVVDPYDIWRLVSLSQLPNRPMQRGHDRMHKAALIQIEAPNGLILGTSRSQVMLDPKSVAFTSHASRVVNAAVDGCIPYEARRILEHAFARAGHSGANVELVVYGLDLAAFAKDRGPNEEHSEERLLVSDSGRAQPFARGADMLPTLLSLDALLATGATLVRRTWPSYLLSTGQRDPGFQERGLVSVGGQRALFRASERDYGENYACFEEGGEDARPYRDLTRLLDEAARHSTKVRLYISPVHARHMVVLRAAGIDHAEPGWKRLLVRVVERARARGVDVELWDFSGVAFDEEVPTEADRASRMSWWWESSHAHSALGERLLPRMLGAPGAEPLGRLLTPSMLEPWLLDLRRHQQTWESTHADELVEVYEQVAATLGKTRREACPRRIEPSVP